MWGVRWFLSFAGVGECKLLTKLNGSVTRGPPFSHLEIWKMRKHSASDKRRNGFTLIELIIVLLVLASLAALVVPTLGFVKDQSDTALSANGAQNVLNNLEMFKASHGHYPNRLDSLVDETGNFYSRVYNGSGTPLYGTVLPGGGSGFAWYWMSNGGAIDQVAVHNSANTTGDPNVAGQPVQLSGGTPLWVMEPGYSPGPGMSGIKERALINSCYPNQSDPNQPAIPAGRTLVFLGVGASNSAVGATMTQAPLAPEKTGSEASEYDRYIAAFDVSSGGAVNRGNVQLRAVLDPEFNVVARNIQFYNNSRPGDDLGS